MTPQELAQAQEALTSSFAINREWIPALAGILGALVGAIAAFIPNLIVESRRLRQEACLVEASLLAEMTALVEVAEERDYLTDLANVIARLEQQPHGSTFSVSANIPTHYSRVYQANAHRIGIIDKRKATDIIRFYQLVDAVVQDVTAGGALNAGAAVEAFKQNHQILSRAFEIHRKYADRT